MRVLAKDIIEEAKNHPDTELEVSGWAHRIRDMGGITFLVLRDRSGLLQLVLNEKPVDASGNPLTLESVISARGIPALNEKAPGGAELRVSSLSCINRSDPEIPFQVNADVSKIGLEAILNNRPLSLRNPKIRSIFKIQSTIVDAFAAYLRGRDFTEIKTSKLVAGGTEGGAELFSVEYFDRKVYLAQSPQAYKEIMVSSGLERVFEIAPAYRAEKHDTPRHLNEYISLDIEMGFIESELDLIELEKGLLASIFEQVKTRNAADLAAWNAKVPEPEAVSKSPIIPYDEAVKIANEEAGKSKQAASRIFDINPEAERFLCDWALRERGSDIIFVNEFPRRYRPFYTYPK
jgi:nondiscriminating aspartyl-tRNA synthetase